jgi:ABC-type Zn uptake system ZnuABC Zn-binding protein ZnuA
VLAVAGGRATAALLRCPRTPSAGSAALAAGLHLVAGVVLGVIVLCLPSVAAAAPLRVVATVPDVATLVRAVGGEEVTVTVLAKPTEDPHFVEARPSFVKALSDADLLVLIGMDLEQGYLPLLVQNARNRRIVPGASGYVDCSTVIAILETPSGPVDRSMGDVHPFGNPHYMPDPINGLRVARLVRDRLAAARPEGRDGFERRTADFARRLGERLVGAPLAAKYDVEKLAALDDRGRLDDFLGGQGDAAALGGWLGRLRPLHGAKVVDDHNVWAYFAHRFGLTVVGHMEPKPGIPPTTHHLELLVGLMKAEQVRVILASAFYDPRHAAFLADHTGARVVPMANQAGSRPGTEDYLDWIDYNVREVAGALGKGS